MAISNIKKAGMENFTFGFEKLTVWQKSRLFVAYIYDVTRTFPENEKFCLTNQIRRASVSITANIAEGSSRLSKKDQAHFTQISYSSLMEVVSHIYVAFDLGFIPADALDKIKTKARELSAMLNALRNYQTNS